MFRDPNFYPFRPCSLIKEKIVKTLVGNANYYINNNF